MKTAAELVKQLELQPHPEGGWYKEIYRSPNTVDSNGKLRSVLTGIYFLLEENKMSRWHVVDADEVWHFYEGYTLELFVASPDFSEVKVIRLNEISNGALPVYVVPKGWWQAARTTGKFTLVGCNVAPGFEFAGFRFATEAECAHVKSVCPDYAFLL
jgi:predicted cupin superfamily sugar epimerase